MAGSNDFLQWNPEKNNMLSTTDYENHSIREDGIESGVRTPAPSNLHNKLYYQVSTMCAAIGEMMKAKGYTVSDASLVDLITVLSNILTDADMSGYVTTGDLAGYIAKAAVVTKTTDYTVQTSDFYKTLQANKATAVGFTLPAYSAVANGAWIKFKNVGAGALTLVSTIDGSANPVLYQYDEVIIYSDGTSWRGKRTFNQDYYVLTKFVGTPYQENGYQKLPTGFMMSWGKYDALVTAGSYYSVTFPLAYTTCTNVVATAIGATETNKAYPLIKSIDTSGFEVYANGPDGATANGFLWQAFGVVA
jgi:hypothetical protein